MQLIITDYGDEDSALYVVEDEKGNVYFSTRSWTEAENYIATIEAQDRVPDVETELMEVEAESGLKAEMIETEIIGAELEAPVLKY